MNRRQALAGISTLAVSLATTASRSAAMDSTAPVDKERAKELGMEVRSRGAGPDAAWVELVFEARGELKGIEHVDLEMFDGKRLVLSTILRNNQPNPGRFAVSFTAARTALDKLTLRVMSNVGLGSVGYTLRVADFVDLKQLR